MIFKKKPKGIVIYPNDTIVLNSIELEHGGFLIEKDQTITNILKRSKKEVI